MILDDLERMLADTAGAFHERMYREAEIVRVSRPILPALIEVARAAEESPLMKELCEDCCGRGRVVIGEDHTEIDCPNCSGTGLAVPEFAPIRSALSRLKGSAAKEAKG
jgi:ribosomal protein S27E